MKDKKQLNINYRMFGSGHPVLFLHGFLESISMWEILNLSQLNCTCILVDIPGHGKSELHPSEDPSIQFFADEITGLMKQLAIEEYNVVGHSMGGYVGLELMRMNPKIGKILLMNSNFWADSEAKKKDRVAVADIVWKSKSLFLKTAIPNLFFESNKYPQEIKTLIEEAELMVPYSIAYASLAMRNRLDFTEFVQNNPSKIKVIQGENDPIVPMEIMNSILPKEVEITYLKHCGHMSHIENTDAVIISLIEFSA